MTMGVSTKFKVIDGNKKDTQWWHEKYKSIIDNILLNLNPYDRYQYMKLCRCLVKDFNCICKLEDNSYLIFQAGTETTQLLARLTPKEFLITFIPNKVYDGKKYECIDVNIMCAISKIYKEYNGTDIFDDFMKSLGKEPLTKYYKVKTPSGKKVLVDEAGKKVNTKKVYPKYVRRVK